MIATHKNIARTGDLPLAVRAAMGIGAKIPVSRPVLTQTIPAKNLSITVQADGQIAIFNRLGLIGCECQGKPVLNLPIDSEVEAVLWHGGSIIWILSSCNHFYSRRENEIVQLKNYDPTIKASRKADPLSENDEDGGCDLWHTNDDSTNEYHEEIEEKTGEDFPIPRWGQDDQVENDPKEGR